MGASLDTKLEDELSCQSALAAKLASQIDMGFKRRDVAYVQQVFDRHMDASGVLPKEQALHAFRELGMNVKDARALDEIFFESNTSSVNSLKFQDFWLAAQRPSPLQQWTTRMPLAQLLAEAFPPTCSLDPLKAVSTLCVEDLEVVIGAFVKGLRRLLVAATMELKRSYEILEAKKAVQKDGQAAFKFKINTVSGGHISDFHAGISGRVGTPHLDFENAIRMEHCIKSGSSTPFTTPNYNITTTPKAEWQLVVSGDTANHDMRHGRRIPRIEDLLKSETVTASKLTRIEVIVVVLYTGPMFYVYNTMLRHFPHALFETFAGGGNLYSSTIHALVSAVQKIAKVTRVHEGMVLYRGLGGTMDLPAHFWKADEHGSCGYAEWGFMSTTSNKEVAIAYSGIRDDKPVPIVLEIRVGTVDRGACIHDFSQYPAEVEHLWVPCSFLEPMGGRYLEVTNDGPVTLIPVRVNANLKTMLLEDLVAQKKNHHLASFQYILDELPHDLNAIACDLDAEARLKRDFCSGGFSVEGLLDQIRAECQATYDVHAQLAPSVYTNDEEYQRLGLQMLEVKGMAVSKLKWWIADPVRSLSDHQFLPLRACHRGRITFLERKLRDLQGAERHETAMELCKLRGLLHASVDETNDLGEVTIIRAGSEGANERDLRLLRMVGADVNTRNRHGVTALMFASRHGYPDTVAVLARMGADVNAAAHSVEKHSHHMLTPIIYAARYGHTETVQMLVQLGADIHAAAYGITALAAAARQGFADTVTLLHQLGANIHAVDEHMRTPLHWGALNGHPATVVALVNQNADVNAVDAYGWTPLMLASRGGHSATVRTLHSLGAAVDAVSLSGGTAITYAAANEHCAVVEVLQELGAELTEEPRRGMRRSFRLCRG